MSAPPAKNGLSLVHVRHCDGGAAASSPDRSFTTRIRQGENPPGIQEAKAAPLLLPLNLSPCCYPQVPANAHRRGAVQFPGIVAMLACARAHMHVRARACACTCGHVATVCPRSSHFPSYVQDWMFGMVRMGSKFFQRHSSNPPLARSSAVTHFTGLQT